VASAVAAIAALSGAPIGGPALRLEFAKTGTPSRVICVTNLSRAFTRDQWAAQFAVRAREQLQRHSNISLQKRRTASARELRPAIVPLARSGAHDLLFAFLARSFTAPSRASASMT